MERPPDIDPTGIAFLAIGLGLAVALDPWYLGMVFILVGAQRILVGFRQSRSTED